MGVPLVRTKLLAFACGASFAGVMGVVFSAKQVFINPSRSRSWSRSACSPMVILGGMGSIPGAILGATVVTVLNLQVLKGLSLWLNELKNAGVTVIFGYSLANLPTQLEPAKYERMVFGIILVLMMIFRPAGHPARRGAARASVEPSPTDSVMRAPRGARASPSASAGLTARQRAWTSRSSDGGSPRSSAPTAPARRRSSTSSPASTRPTAGTVTFRGHSLVGLRPDQITALGVCRTLPEHPPLRQHDGDRERAGRHARARAARALGRAAAAEPALHARWRRALWRRGRRSCSTRVGLRGQANELARNLPLRRPAPPGARPRAGRPSPRSCCSTSPPPA